MPASIIRIAPPADRDIGDIGSDIAQAEHDLQWARSGIDTAFEFDDPIPDQSVNLLRKARDRINGLLREIGAETEGV